MNDNSEYQEEYFTIYETPDDLIWFEQTDDLGGQISFSEDPLITIYPTPDDIPW